MTHLELSFVELSKVQDVSVLRLYVNHFHRTVAECHSAFIGLLTTSLRVKAGAVENRHDGGGGGRGGGNRNRIYNLAIL